MHEGIASILLSVFSAVDLSPGETYTFFFETPKDLGTIQSMDFYWDAKLTILNPLELLRKDYIYLEGDFLLTEKSELVSVLKPARSDVEEKKDLNAALLRSYKQY